MVKNSSRYLCDFWFGKILSITILFGFKANYQKKYILQKRLNNLKKNTRRARLELVWPSRDEPAHQEIFPHWKKSND